MTQTRSTPPAADTNPGSREQSVIFRSRAAAAPYRLLAGVASLLFLLLPLRSAAQGCTACRDATAGSAPAARSGLRRAIVVLGVPAGAIFLAALWVAYRVEQQRES